MKQGNEEIRLNLGKRTMTFPYLAIFSSIHTYRGEEGHSDYYTVRWLAIILLLLVLIGLGRFAKGLRS